MSEETPTPPDSVLGALPRSRPHRRSDKRTAPAGAKAEPVIGAKAASVPAKAGATKAKASAAKPKAPAARAKAPAAKPRATRAKPAAKAPLHQPPQPRGLPPRRETEPATRPTPGRRDLIGTAVQAAAELTEMGLSAWARALRDAVSRLPRP